MVNVTNTEPMRKEREILFAQFPPDQVCPACEFLAQQEDVQASPKADQLTVEVIYDLRDYTLAALENELKIQGFHLDNTLFSKLMRALIDYVEETQLHNLGAPRRLLKKSQTEAYTQAWERHPHGDHDDTPPEWREYK